jgi:hypothetical protein
VILQGKAAEDEEDVAAPLGVVGSLKIEDDRDQVLDILDGGSLRVLVAMGVTVNALPEGRCLLLQGVCLRALFGESGGTRRTRS